MRIVIPLFDQFTALDAVGPYQVLSEIPGAEVVIAAAQRGPVRSDTGTLAIVADASPADRAPAEQLPTRHSSAGFVRSTRRPSGPLRSAPAL
jgi:putative intracellular protease/amidase